MSDDLRRALLDISGVGEATADKILDAVATHGAGDAPTDTDAVRTHLEAAHDHLEAGQPGHADKFVRRALAELD